MPLKGLLSNIWLLIVYLFSLLFYVGSIHIGTVVAVTGLRLPSIGTIGISGILFIITGLLQVYVLGVFGRTVAQQEHKIQSRGFFNSIGMGLRIVAIAIPYYAIYLATLFMYGKIAVILTIVYLIVLLCILPAILMGGTRNFIQGWNIYGVFKRVFTLEYVKALGVGLVVLVVGFGLVYGVSLGVFVLASIMQAGAITYVIISAASVLLSGLLALYTIFAFVALFFTEPVTDEPKPSKKKEVKK